VFPGVPEKTDFAAKAEEAVRNFCKAHTGKGSGAAFAACFADTPDVYFNEAMAMKISGRKAIEEFVDGLPGGGMVLTPKEIFVATDETKVAALVDVKLPDEAGGGHMDCISFVSLDKDAKYLSNDVFWHAGGVLPGLPGPTDFVAKAEAAVDAFCAAHKGNGSGGAIGDCYTDESKGIYWNEAFVPGMNPSTKQGMVDLFNNFPPGVSLKALQKIVSTDESQVAALIEVTLPDGTKMKALDWVVVEK